MRQSCRTKLRGSGRLAAAVAVAAAGALVAGCGEDSSAPSASASGASGSSSFDAKSATPYAVRGSDPGKAEVHLRGWVPNRKASKDLKLAFFTVTPINTYAQAENYGATTAAKSLGVDLELVKANWDAQQQLNQLQTAVQQKKYDGIITLAIDGDAECRMVSKTATEAFPVVTTTFPICGDPTNTEGTVGLSTTQSLPFYERYADWAFGQLAKEGGGKVGVLSGPAENVPAKLLKTAVTEAAKKYAGDGVEVVANVNGAFTSEAGLSQAQTILQTHPDVDMLLSGYDANTIGAQKALLAAGKEPGQIRLYNVGGDRTTVPLIKQGWIEGTMIFQPADEIAQAVEMMVAHLEGVKGLPQFNNLGDGKSGLTQITKDNVADFTPQY